MHLSEGFLQLVDTVFANAGFLFHSTYLIDLNRFAPSLSSCFKMISAFESAHDPGVGKSSSTIGYFDSQASFPMTRSILEQILVSTFL